jgi:hypothetical protein
MGKSSKFELPWAFAKREGFAGTAPGLYYHYFRTEAEAKKSQIWLKRRGKYAGKIEYRPDECYQLGAVF